MARFRFEIKNTSGENPVTTRYGHLKGAPEPVVVSVANPYSKVATDLDFGGGGGSSGIPARAIQSFGERGCSRLGILIDFPTVRRSRKRFGFEKNALRPGQGKCQNEGENENMTGLHERRIPKEPGCGKCEVYRVSSRHIFALAGCFRLAFYLLDGDHQFFGIAGKPLLHVDAADDGW